MSLNDSRVASAPGRVRGVRLVVLVAAVIFAGFAIGGVLAITYAIAGFAVVGLAALIALKVDDVSPSLVRPPWPNAAAIRCAR
jgi:hypothetical protein